MPAKMPTRENMPLYFLIALLTLFSACGILGSDDDKEPLEPGPRNYEWSVDSVYSAPGGWMNTIWGSSPDDVWIASSGGFDKLWHYDGKEWSPWPYREGPNSFTGDFYSIFGFARDDVWMGGRGPRGEGIWHFDGQVWKLSHTYQPEGMGEPNIKDIWGTSSSDMYAVGTVPTGQDNPSYKGFILHYDGRRWKEVLMTDFGMQFQRIRKSKGEIYLFGSGPYSNQTISDSISFYKVNNNKLQELYSKSRREAGSASMNKTGDKIYFVLENKVMDINFKSVLPFTIKEDVYGVNGRHKKDIFITTENGVLHYNGEDAQHLLEIESGNAVVFRTFILENDVFFLVNDYDAGTNLIYHGTLTKEEEE